MNIERLRAVVARIKQNPAHFDMTQWYDGKWYHQYNDRGIYAAIEDGHVAPERPALTGDCGTVACFAGFADVMYTKDVREMALHPDHAGIRARFLLELRLGQGERLFLVGLWPRQFRFQYEDARLDNDHIRAVEILEARVEHFIATGGDE